MIPKIYTDFNEPEHLQLEDAMLPTFSEALVPFHSSLLRICCMMLTHAHNSSIGRLAQEIRPSPLEDTCPYSLEIPSRSLRTRIVRLQFWERSFLSTLFSMTDMNRNAPRMSA